MFISVLICTRNRADSLRKTLDSLLCPGNVQTPEWEVLVVDNGSNDHTPEVCDDFREKFPAYFRSVVEKRPGKSNALNRAIREARGDILAFTDDDVCCTPDYVQAVRAVFSNYPIDAAQGRILLDCEGGHPVWLDRLLGLTVGWRDCGDQVSELDGTLCGTNMVVRSAILRRVGGFLPELGPGRIGLGEETEWSLRIRQAGYRLLYAPQILIHHRLSRKRLNKKFIRKRFFQQGRASAYYEPLPVSVGRFGIYVIKETLFAELASIGHRFCGRPAVALRCQCEARSQAGLLFQHWLFKRGAPRNTQEHKAAEIEVGRFEG